MDDNRLYDKVENMIPEVQAYMADNPWFIDGVHLLIHGNIWMQFKREILEKHHTYVLSEEDFHNTYGVVETHDAGSIAYMPIQVVVFKSLDDITAFYKNNMGG